MHSVKLEIDPDPPTCLCSAYFFNLLISIRLLVVYLSSNYTCFEKIILFLLMSCFDAEDLCSGTEHLAEVFSERVVEGHIPLVMV